MIIEGTLKPGERLVENELCDRFNISRSPIRECFRILESEGLIEIIPRKGAFVSELPVKELEDAFVVRASLEGLAAKLATPRMDDDKIAIMTNLVEKMDMAIKDKKIKDFIKCNYSFHSLFIKYSENVLLEKLLAQLGKTFWLRIAYQISQEQSMLNISNNFHKDIIKAFRQGDANQAELLVKKHVEHGKKMLF